ENARQEGRASNGRSHADADECARPDARSRRASAVRAEASSATVIGCDELVKSTAPIYSLTPSRMSPARHQRPSWYCAVPRGKITPGDAVYSGRDRPTHGLEEKEC